MLFTNWMGSYRYRREMNRHWSVSTPRHRSEDDKTICKERALIDDLFFWTSSIIFIRDEIRDHLSEFFLYLTQIFIILSVYSRCPAARERIWSAGDLFFWISPNQIRAAPQSEQSSIPASHQTLAISHFTPHIKPLNLYNGVRFWITRRTIRRRTTDHNHKQKERRSEEEISDAKNSNLKKT
jgi:hypothetical protein